MLSGWGAMRGGRAEEEDDAGIGRAKLRRPSGGLVFAVGTAGVSPVHAVTDTSQRGSPQLPVLLALLVLLKPLVMLRLLLLAGDVLPERDSRSGLPGPLLVAAATVASISSPSSCAIPPPLPLPPPPPAKRATLKDETNIDESCRLCGVDGFPRASPPADPPAPGCGGGSALTMTLPSRSVKPVVLIS